MNKAPSERENPEVSGDTPAVITEANWQEMKTQGFQMLIDQVDLSTSVGQESLKVWQDTYGPEHVYTGSAFEWDERRPLDHKPGRGIYVDREGVRQFLDTGLLYEERHPPDGGPASSR